MKKQINGKDVCVREAPGTEAVGQPEPLLLLLHPYYFPRSPLGTPGATAGAAAAAGHRHGLRDLEELPREPLVPAGEDAPGSGTANPGGGACA